MKLTCEVFLLHSPHPSSHGAQWGSHSEGPPGPSHPHQPCAASPSPAGAAEETPLSESHI